MADTPPLVALEELIGHRFSDTMLLECALRHRSWVKDGNHPVNLEDNERLEFLGDAVLGMVVTERLYRLSRSAEGRLTRARALLVRRETLARHARSLGLGDFVRLGRGERSSGGANKDSILADVLEAVIGATYLDGGLEAAGEFVGRLFAEDLSRRAQDGDLLAPRDARTELQESLQAAGRGTPSYRLAASSGPDHAPTWTMEVVLDDELLGTGEGSSKQDAARCAAARALEALGAEPVANGGSEEATTEEAG